jgi:hypothetical protein
MVITVTGACCRQMSAPLPLIDSSTQRLIDSATQRLSDSAVHALCQSRQRVMNLARSDMGYDSRLCGLNLLFVFVLLDAALC